jgi:hypothetical protein
MATNFSNKASILADLWINFRADEQFTDFVEYNDIGLPLAYFVHTDLVKPNDQAIMYIEETFNLLCAALGIDLEQDYETLNEMFDKANNQ